MDYDIDYLSILSIINFISNTTLHTITGNMLVVWSSAMPSAWSEIRSNKRRDGSISLSKINKGEGKYSMTMDVYSLNYLHYLNENNYRNFLSKTV